MSYVPHLFQTPVSLVTRYWNGWKAAYNQAITDYYNQQIELNPEGEAHQYWSRLKHPQSGINVQQISDAMLSRLMNSLLEQGISKFAVDRFILELRRLTRVSAGFELGEKQRQYLNRV